MNIFSNPQPISDFSGTSFEYEIYRYIDEEVSFSTSSSEDPKGRCPYINGALRKSRIFFSLGLSPEINLATVTVLAAADWYCNYLLPIRSTCLILAFPQFQNETSIDMLWNSRQEISDYLDKLGLTGALSYRKNGALKLLKMENSLQPSTPFWVIRAY